MRETEKDVPQVLQKKKIHFFCLKGRSGKTHEDKSIQSRATSPRSQQNLILERARPCPGSNVSPLPPSWRQRRHRPGAARNPDLDWSGGFCSPPTAAPSLQTERNPHPLHLIEQISYEQLLSASMARFHFITADKRSDSICALQL